MRRTLFHGEYPGAVKITAEDCLYSFAKRKELRKIEVGYDDHDAHVLQQKLFKTYICGEWGSNTGDIEPELIEPVNPRTDSICLAKRMTRDETKTVYGVDLEEKQDE